MFGFNQTQPQQSPFGAAPAAAPFGAAAPAFGAQPQPQSPFGAPAAPAGGGLFGNTGGAFGAAPAFGAASAPAFGAAAPAPAFGATNAFGANRPAGAFGGFGTPTTSTTPASPFGSTAQPGAFGAPTSNAFGAASAPAFGAITTAPSFGGAPSAFGASSTPAFGAQTTAPAFGASSAPGFGGFGAASTPAFGAANTGGAFGAPQQASPAFGATAASPFGAAPAAGGLFGASSPAGGFGTAAPAFGAPSSPFGGGAPVAGTRGVPFQKTQDKDGTTAGGQAAVVYFNCITAMQAYQGKCFEELRFEDYQQGVKNNSAAPAPAAGAFGATTSPGGAFGAPAAQPTGAFGTTSASPFGQPPAATPSLFGPTTSAFGTPGQSQPAFGSTAFGASSSPFGATTAAPAFGQPQQQAASPFGAPASTSVFGQAAPAAASPFGTTTGGSLFGGSSAPAFGASQPAASSGGAFSFNSSPGGLFGTAPASNPASPFGSAPSMFGANTAGAFGAAASAPAFGSSTSAPAFSFSSSTPGAFGTTNAFGATAAKPATSAAPFGTTNLFGSAPASGTSIFGNTTGGLSLPTFGSQPAQTGSLFPSTQSTFGLGMSAAPFGQPQQQAQQAPAAPPSLSQAPYGSFPALPEVPEPKVGISTRPSRSVSINTSKASPLLAMRPGTLRMGVNMPRAGSAGSGLGLGLGRQETSSAITAAGATLTTPMPATTSTALVASDGGAGGASSGASALLPTRANPHRLFIREPPPSTSSAASPMLTPAKTSGSKRSPHHEAMAMSPLNGTPDRFFSAANGHGANGGGARLFQDGGADGADGGASSDSGLLPRLGRLAVEGYRFEPSATQLEAMAKQDPDSLKQVKNFTVVREDVGQIRWLNPVDVRGLQLDRIVSIQPGEVFCYADCPKPPVGEGLNTDAEISLLGVYKRDKATGQPVRDGSRLLQWERKLRAMCSQMGAKFVSYKPDAGVWKFEVEHFSRYGLLDLDDSDDEEGGAGGAQSRPGAMSDEPEPSFMLRHAPGAGSRGQLQQQGEEGEPGSDGDEAMQPYARPVGAGSGQDGAVVAGGRATAMDMEDGADGPLSSGLGVPLQHNLPARLDLDPQDLLAMRESFFPGPSAAAAARAAGGAFGAAVGTPLALPCPPALPPGALGTPATAAASGRAPPHAWKRSPAPITSPLPASRYSPSAMMESSSPSPGPLGLPAPPAMAAASAAGLAELADLRSSAHFLDAGLALGRAFRVGWGPGGQLAFPDKAEGGPTGRVVCVRRVLVEGSSDAYAAEGEGRNDLRERLRAALRVHLRASGPLQPGAGAGGSSGSGGSRRWALPQWGVSCSRRQLGQLVDGYIKACQSLASSLSSPDMAQGHGDTELPRQGALHEAETWALLQVLYGHLAGEEDDPAAAEALAAAGLPPPATASGADTAMDDGAEAEAAGSHQSLLAGFKRRAALSAWLQKQAKDVVESELGSCESSSQVLLQLLSGHQLAAAAAAAAVVGDTRLATLLAQAGSQPSSAQELSQQLATWASAQLAGHVAPDRLLLYRLLAGQVEEAQAALKADWRRFLGMTLWYGTPATASLAEAVECYSRGRAANPAVVPHPAPHYASGLASGSLLAQLSGMAATDVQLELLLLWAQTAVSPAVAVAGGPEALAGYSLAQLLRPAGYSPNPLDSSLAWHLLTVMEAIRALPPSHAPAPPSALPSPPPPELLSAHLDYIAQLQLCGGLSEWTAYAALHLPDHPQWPGLRDQVVSEVLCQSCPEWAEDPVKTRFLLETLGLPQALLAEARAQWAASRGDQGLQCRELAAAGQWQAAHSLLREHVAPRLLLAGRLSELSELCGRLAPPPPEYQEEWEAGGALFARFLEVVPAPGATAATAPVDADHLQAVQELAARIQKASAAAAAAAAAGAPVMGGYSAPAGPAVLRQRMAYSHMAARLQAAQLFGGPTPLGRFPAEGAARAALLPGALAVQCVPPEMRMFGVAAAVSEAAAAVLV